MPGQYSTDTLKFAAVLDSSQFMAQYAQMAGAIERLGVANPAAGMLSQASGGAIALGAAITGVDAKAVQMAATFQRSQAAFESMIGKANGDALFGQLQKFTINTPFQLQDWTKATQILLGFKVAQKDILPDLQSLGNVMAAMGRSGSDMQRAAVQMGELNSMPASMRQLRALTMDGLPAIGLLTDAWKKYGITQQQVGEIGKAHISGQLVMNTILAQAQLEYGEGMRKQMQTLSGSVTSLKDAWQMFLGKVGAPALQPFTNAVKGITSELLRFQSMAPGVQKAVGELFLFGGPALLLAGAFVKINMAINAYKGNLALTKIASQSERQSELDKIPVANAEAAARMRTAKATQEQSTTLYEVIDAEYRDAAASQETGLAVQRSAAIQLDEYGLVLKAKKQLTAENYLTVQSEEAVALAARNAASIEISSTSAATGAINAETVATSRLAGMFGAAAGAAVSMGNKIMAATAGLRSMLGIMVGMQALNNMVGAMGDPDSAETDVLYQRYRVNRAMAAAYFVENPAMVGADLSTPNGAQGFKDYAVAATREIKKLTPDDNAPAVKEFNALNPQIQAVIKNWKNVPWKNVQFLAEKINKAINDAKSGAFDMTIPQSTMPVLSADDIKKMKALGGNGKGSSSPMSDPAVASQQFGVDKYSMLFDVAKLGFDRKHDKADYSDMTNDFAQAGRYADKEITALKAHADAIANDKTKTAEWLSTMNKRFELMQKIATMQDSLNIAYLQQDQNQLDGYDFDVDKSDTMYKMAKYGYDKKHNVKDFQDMNKYSSDEITAINVDIAARQKQADMIEKQKGKSKDWLEVEKQIFALQQKKSELKDDMGSAKQKALVTQIIGGGGKIDETQLNKWGINDMMIAKLNKSDVDKYDMNKKLKEANAQRMKDVSKRPLVVHLEMGGKPFDTITKDIEDDVIKQLTEILESSQR